MGNDANRKTFKGSSQGVLPDERVALVTEKPEALDGAAGPMKQPCPYCKSDAGLHRFRNGPKSGTTLYGCFACGEEWPVEKTPGMRF